MENVMSRVVCRRLGIAVALFCVCAVLHWSLAAFDDSSFGDKMIAMTASERLVDDALRSLEECPAFSAKVDFETRLFGKQYYGSGEYKEFPLLRDASSKSLRAPLERVNFMLNVQMAPERDSEEAPDSLNIVCDCNKRAWWRNDATNSPATLSQINLDDLRNSLSYLGEEETRRLRENGVTRSCGMNGMPGLGGLAGTLKRVASYYRFDPNYQEVVSSRQNVDATIPDVAFLKIVGVANSRYWDLIHANLNDHSSAVPDYIAENLPTSVEVYFRNLTDSSGRRRPFPCKFQYFCDDASGKGEERRLLFSVEYSTVVFNDPNVQLSDFDYIQPAITFERLTDEYVRELTEPLPYQ